MGRKFIVWVLLLLCFSPAIYSITIEEIVNKLEGNLYFDTAKTTGELIIKDRFGTTETSFISYAEGSEKVLIEFTNAEQSGQKILRLKDEMYLFYPDAEELILLQGSSLRESLFNSDISYEDMSGGRKILESYNVVLNGEEDVEGNTCYKLTLTAKVKNIPFPKQILWVDKALFIHRKIQQYSVSDKLIREISTLEYKKIGNVHFVSHQVIKDTLKKNSSTELIINELKINIPIDPKMFSLRELTW